MAEFYIYDKARALNKAISYLLRTKQIDHYKGDQILRASNSLVLTIAEGNGRFTSKDRMHYFIISRGSAQELRACIDLLEDEAFMTPDEARPYRDKITELIKMLTQLILNLHEKHKP